MRAEPRPGTARAALAQRDFRIMYTGGFASNVGTWMQNVVLGPFAYKLAGGSATFAGLVIFAQLGPLLLLSIPGGALANRARRRPYMICAQSEQLLFALALAALATQARPSRLLVVLAVLGGGIGNAMVAPVYQAVLPDLVGRENLAGAVSLNSAQINGSRVIAPILIAVLRGFLGTSDATFFVINAITFLFVIVSLLLLHFPAPPPRTSVSWRDELLVGIREVRRNPVARRTLALLFTMSLVCLPFVGQFPTVAERNFGIDSKSTVYAAIYGTWGFGAMLGSLSMSTVFAHVDKRRIISGLFAAFGVMLGLFSVLSSSGPAFPVGALLGFFYFGCTTAMMTVLQQHLQARTRAPVMALWFMCFGGTVPLGSMWGGWAMDHWSVTGVLLIGAVTAIGLAFRGDLLGPSRQQHLRESQLARELQLQPG